MVIVYALFICALQPVWTGSHWVKTEQCYPQGYTFQTEQACENMQRFFASRGEPANGKWTCLEREHQGWQPVPKSR